MSDARHRKCGHSSWHHCGDGHSYILPEGCFGDDELGHPECKCLHYVKHYKNRKDEDMDDEVGKGSPLKKWVCQCQVHMVDVKSQKTRKGPYIIRCTGDALVAICQWCEAPFVRVDEGLPRRRKSKICGAHCPEGAHDHV